jgi:polar amino acid transport system permease protein
VAAVSLDFSWIVEPVYLHWLMQGTVTTLSLSAFGLFLTLLIGITGAICLHFKIPVLTTAVTVLVELARNTPSLVQLFFLYFILSETGFHFTDVKTGRDIPIFSGFMCCVLMLGFYNGAIAVDIIRSGLLAVPRETVEATKSLGYTRWQTFIYVELPISLRLTIPLMANNIVMLIKTSSQAALVAVADLMYSATQIVMENFKSFEVMVVVWAMYITIVSGVVGIIGEIEKFVKMPGYNA